MTKKLPKVFANSLNKIDNNETVFYSAETKEIEKMGPIKEEKIILGQTVLEKISNIFNSPNYVYKATVEITLDTGVVIKHIIGKNKNNLITLDNELIPISQIVDIKYK